MGKVFLIGEDHSLADRGLLEYDYFYELMGRIKIYAISFETDEANPIAPKPSVEFPKGNSRNAPIVLNLSVAGLARTGRIPIIYADRRDFPEFKEKEEFEERMDPDSDEDILKYADLIARFLDKRDAYTVGVLDHHIRIEKKKVIAHICGYRHLPNLKERLVAIGHQVFIKVIRGPQEVMAIKSHAMRKLLASVEAISTHDGDHGLDLAQKVVRFNIDDEGSINEMHRALEEEGLLSCFVSNVDHEKMPRLGGSCVKYYYLAPDRAAS